MASVKSEVSLHSFTDTEFDELVDAAIASIPGRFLDELDNVVFMVEDEPSSDTPDILGLYNGVNVYDRADGYGMFDDTPDIITIFKGPHERLAGSEHDIVEEIRKTVVHEVGHYFGMDEEQIERMGYGAIE